MVARYHDSLKRSKTENMKYENKERDRVKYLKGLFDGIRKHSDFMRVFLFFGSIYFSINFPRRTAPSPYIQYSVVRRLAIRLYKYCPQNRKTLSTIDISPDTGRFVTFHLNGWIWSPQTTVDIFFKH